ncbi:MAG TPA: hypothetical protein VND64_34370 [Pirellulales bacterium]|nr:hypothetical protein [Pirellulales bacterium]
MFDPYHKWLGIPTHFRPPTYYQLLGISPQEQDLDVIDAAALRQCVFVRHFQSGPHAADATRILTEIATAKLCLLNPQKRSQYDAELQRSAPPPDSPRSPPSLKKAPPTRASNAASLDVPLDLAPDPELDASSYSSFRLAPNASPPAKPAPSATPSVHEAPPPRAVTGPPAPPVTPLLDLNKLPTGHSTRSTMRGFASQPRLGARHRKLEESSVPYGLLAALAGALIFVLLVIVYLRTRPALPMTPEMLLKREANQASRDDKRATP